jgi:hypothetical protein
MVSEKVRSWLARSLATVIGSMAIVKTYRALVELGREGDRAEAQRVAGTQAGDIDASAEAVAEEDSLLEAPDEPVHESAPAPSTIFELLGIVPPPAAPAGSPGDGDLGGILGVTPKALVAALSDPEPESALHELMVSQLAGGEQWAVLYAQLATLLPTFGRADAKRIGAIAEAMRFLYSNTAVSSLANMRERANTISVHRNDAELWAALDAPQPEEALHAAIKRRLEAGCERAVMLAQMEALRARADLAGDEEREDHILGVMDAIVGWCSPGWRL